jgi:hypothetical protein
MGQFHPKGQDQVEFVCRFLFWFFRESILKKPSMPFGIANRIHVHEE